MDAVMLLVVGCCPAVDLNLRRSSFSSPDGGGPAPLAGQETSATTPVAGSIALDTRGQAARWVASFPFCCLLQQPQLRPHFLQQHCCTRVELDARVTQMHLLKLGQRRQGGCSSFVRTDGERGSSGNHMSVCNPVCDLLHAVQPSASLDALVSLSARMGKRLGEQREAGERRSESCLLLRPRGTAFVVGGSLRPGNAARLW